MPGHRSLAQCLTQNRADLEQAAKKIAPNRLKSISLKALSRPAVSPRDAGAYGAGAGVTVGGGEDDLYPR